MAFAIFDGLFGSDDPVSPLSNPDAGTGTAVLERPVVALCGKVWVPKRDPTHYPVCPDCKRIYDEMMNSSF